MYGPAATVVGLSHRCDACLVRECRSVSHLCLSHGHTFRSRPAGHWHGSGSSGARLRRVTRADSANPVGYFVTLCWEDSMRSIRLLAAATSILVLGSGCGGDGGGVQPGTAPVASFTAPTCTPGVACTFTSTSTDADGTIPTQTWDFGDTHSGSGATASNTFATAGTYQVKLTVTDDSGLTGSVTNPVTVAA